jgi:hypothetical protein
MPRILIDQGPIATHCFWVETLGDACVAPTSAGSEFLDDGGIKIGVGVDVLDVVHFFES